MTHACRVTHLNADARSIIFVSSVSALEITIKRQLGKLASPSNVSSLLASNRFHELAVSVAHAEAINRLPMIHKDPFDRLLIAQAQMEKLTLVTRDGEIQKYDVPTLAA